MRPSTHSVESHTVGTEAMKSAHSRSAIYAVGESHNIFSGESYTAYIAI